MLSTVAAILWLLAVPLGMTYLQAVADARSYASDATCTAGLGALPSASGACGVGIVVVGNGSASRDGRYELSLKFSDGARRELPVSRRTYALLRAPGTLAFVQVHARRITLIGDARSVETTLDHPRVRLRSARTVAVAALAAALAVTAGAAVRVRRDARTGRPNDGA